MIASLFAGLHEPPPEIDDVLAEMAATPDAELVFRMTELVQVFASVAPGRAADWLRDILAAKARLSGHVQQRLSDALVQALAMQPAGRRGSLVATYADAIEGLAAPVRERELRLFRRAIRLLPRGRQHEIEARLDR